MKSSLTPTARREWKWEPSKKQETQARSQEQRKNALDGHAGLKPKTSRASDQSCHCQTTKHSISLTVTLSMTFTLLFRFKHFDGTAATTEPQADFYFTLFAAAASKRRHPTVTSPLDIRFDQSGEDKRRLL
jgi:hypothetical protein